MSSTDVDPKYRWKVLGIVMVGTLMSALDSSIVNVSVPAIMADFGSSVDEIEWIVTGYMLAFAVLMPLTSWLRDRVGHKFLYNASLIVFTAGSVLCGLAWNLPTLIAARVIQAAGGGALTPTGMAMITENFEPHERGRALGFWAMGAIMGPAFGPTLGGYLTKYFGWPSIFLVNLPIGLIGLYFSQKILMPDKPAPHTHRPFDAWGFAFLSVFLVAFLLALSKGESKGWESPLVVTCMILAFIGFVFFMVVELNTDYKIIDLELLTRPVFAAAFVLTAVRSLALYGGTFLLPVFLQNYKGLDEVESGLILLPGSLLMGALMPITGRMADKIAPRWMALGGFILLAIFFYQYRTLDLVSSTWDIVSPTLVRGAGVAMLIAPLTATAMNAVPKHKAGMASSMLNLIQQVGGSAGIAVLGLVLDHRSIYHLSLAGTAVSTGSSAYKESFGRFFERARDIGMNQADALRASGAAVGQAIGKAATVHAFQDAFLVGAVIVVVSIVGVFFLPKKTVGEKVGLEAAME